MLAFFSILRLLLHRFLFRPTQWAAEVNAAVASVGFAWLVGESELQDGDVQVAPGVVRRQRSVVHIKKCRYLEASGCVGLCTNMCKVPTQSFFTDDFGMPLTMNPNFETLSCDMIFGQAPPPVREDAVAVQPCFTMACSAAQLPAAPDTPCPKLFMEPGASTSSGRGSRAGRSSEEATAGVAAGTRNT
jgi:Beta-carotene isomerase D27-like, C-terminal